MLYFKKGENTTETHTKKICAVYGEGAMTGRTCQKWFAKFHSGNFLLDNAPWLGRPVEVDSDEIETLTENGQRSALREIAEILEISKSTKLLVKNVSFILWKKVNRLLRPTQYF